MIKLNPSKMKIALPAIAAFILLVSCDTPSPSSEAKAYEKISDFKAGDHCVLRNGLANIVVPGSKEELDKILNLAVNKDDEGITLEVAKGRAFLVKAETKVIVVNSNSTTSEIRIENGPMKYKSGWVPNEFIKSN